MGGTMIADSLLRTYNYLEKRNSQNANAQDAPYDHSDHGPSTEKDSYDRSNDRDSWDREY